MLEALGRLGKRMIGADRLIVYDAGYGWFDAAGDASLLLDGQAPLGLRDLSERAAELVPGHVTFVLDTSFGAPAPDVPRRAHVPDGALLPLIARPTWRALVGSTPGQVAHEDGERGGLFTRWLLTGCAGPPTPTVTGVSPGASSSATRATGSARSRSSAWARRRCPSRWGSPTAPSCAW